MIKGFRRRFGGYRLNVHKVARLGRYISGVGFWDGCIFVKDNGKQSNKIWDMFAANANQKEEQNVSVCFFL